MTANPIELIGGITTTADVPKADIVAWAKARVPQTMANATEVTTTDLAGQIALTLKTTGGFYYLDTSDTTSAHDGTAVLVSHDGKRFKLLTSIVAPTAISLGGVFSSAAVTNQFLTGIDTAGNVLRAQPAAADLSNGVTGSGAVVLGTAPTIAGGTHDALTSLGIRSTGAAFDLKFATAEVLTADRTLSWTMGNANRAVTLAGDVTLAGALTTAGAYALTLTQTGATNVTLPTTGTLATLAGAETLTNKGINATNNTITNLTTAMFAANVVDTDGTLAANSDTRLASQKATKTYLDQIIAAADAMVFQGVIDCSANPNYPAADRGWTYKVSVAGKIGGASGTTVDVGDTLLCITDSTASGDQATVGAQWNIVQANLVGAVTGPTSSTSGNIATFNGTGGTVIQDGGKALPTGAVVGTTDSQALTGKTYNGLTLTSTTGTFTLAAGKTLTTSNTLTFAGTDGSSVAFGTGGTVLYSGGALGTPSSGTATNLTGLPVASGISGLGTGIATALAVNVGSAGAPVLFNGAGGTPSSLTLTSATGLPTAGLVNNAVTLGKMAQVATATFLGRTTAATGDVEALTATQATALLNLATTSVKGLLPVLSNDATQFLNGTGNFSNIEVSSFAASAVVTAAETIAANNNDTTIPTSAAVKAYADGLVAGGFTAATTTEQLAGTVTAAASTPDSVAALWEKGSSVASAGTISLGEGGFFHITGTTTITDIDFATAKDGRGAWLEFDGALTLTHHATTLVLPGGANILTAAGDRAFFIQDSSDNVHCMAYVRAAEAPAISGSFTATLTGCTTSPTMTINYAKVGRVVTLSASGTGGISGTSNATTKTLTGMPASLYPAANTFFLGSGSDNGGAYVTSLSYVSTGGTLLLYKDIAGSGWTASGTAGFYFMTISYVAAS